MKILSAVFQVSSSQRQQMLDITEQVQRAVYQSQSREGIVHIFVPHTTAAVAINENADPDVKRDVLAKLAEVVPHKGAYQHSEANSDAHIKTILTGSLVAVFISEGNLQLGQWQGIFLCEFDGPRQRSVWLKIIAE